MMTSGSSPEISIWAIDSRPITVWWRITWLRTEPSEYFVSSRDAASFGFHQRSGNFDNVSIRLEAQVNPDRISATAELWHSGVLYKLTDRRAVPNADDDLASIIAALKAEDWAALYRSSYSGVRGQMAEADFVAGIGTTFAARGHVVDASLISAVSYGDGSAGFDMASARVAVTLSKGGAPSTMNGQAILVWEAGRWQLYSITPES